MRVIQVSHTAYPCFVTLPLTPSRCSISVLLEPCSSRCSSPREASPRLTVPPTSPPTPQTNRKKANPVPTDAAPPSTRPLIARTRTVRAPDPSSRPALFHISLHSQFCHRLVHLVAPRTGTGLCHWKYRGEIASSSLSHSNLTLPYPTQRIEVAWCIKACPNRLLLRVVLKNAFTGATQCLSTTHAGRNWRPSDPRRRYHRRALCPNTRFRSGHRCVGPSLLSHSDAFSHARAYTRAGVGNLTFLNVPAGDAGVRTEGPRRV